MTIGQQIEELQDKKRREDSHKIAEEKKEQARRKLGILGKVYKRQNSWGGSGSKAARQIFHTIEYLYLTGTTNSNHLYWAHKLELQISPTGWQLITDTLAKDPELIYVHGINEIKINPNRYTRYYENIKLGKDGNYCELFNTNGVIIAEDLRTLSYPKDSSYHRDTDYQEITLFEFYDAVNTSNSLATDMYTKLKKFLDYSKVAEYLRDDTKEFIPELTLTTIKKLEDLFKHLDTNKDLKLNTLVKELSGKVARYNYFNADNQLAELCQYRIGGDKGLFLSIESGNGGTDYEPYTTHYYISNIKLDWAHILYPIRLQLSCKVMDLVNQLENLTSVYNTDNWNCLYDSSGYDAVFSSAELQPQVLQKVNLLIFDNLK